MLAVGITWWRQSLLVAIPMVLFAYGLFIFYLFRAPLWLVAGCWIACALLTLFGTKIIFSGPLTGAGPFSVSQIFSSVLFWPVTSMISALALPDQLHNKKQTKKKRAARKARHDEERALEGEIEGTVSFVEPAGIEGNFLMVFLKEHGNTVFYAPALPESGSMLEKEKRFLLKVERREEVQLGGNVPWIAGVEPSSS